MCGLLRVPNLLLLGLAVAACDDDDPDVGNIEVNVVLPCQDECTKDEINIGTVNFTLLAGATDTDVTCDLSSSGDVDVGSSDTASPLGTDPSQIITNVPLTLAAPTLDETFRYRCRGVGQMFLGCEDASGRAFLDKTYEIDCPVVTPTGPTCGVAVFRGSEGQSASNLRTIAAVVTPNSTDATAAESIADRETAPAAIAIGACADAPIAAAITSGVDLGPSIDMKEGTTTRMTVNKGTGNVYQGFGGLAPQPTGVIALEHTATTVTPSRISLGTFQPPVAITAPADGVPATITRGQPYTFTWSPVAGVTGMYVVFSADQKLCRLDPAAGTMTVPGTVTQDLTTGQYGVSIFSTHAGVSAASVNGTACVIKTVTATVVSRQVSVN